MTTEQGLDALIAAAHQRPWKMPAHVIGRVGFLVGDEKVLFVDAALTAGAVNGDGLTGQVFVLTPTKAVHVTFKESHELGEKERSATSTVEATMWSRTRLRGVWLPGFYDGVNPDTSWNADNGDLWPYDAQVKLQYEHGTTVTLPLSAKEQPSQRRTIRAMVAALLDDLS